MEPSVKTKGEYAVKPDLQGRFGSYGGSYVPETLVPALQELSAAFDSAWSDPEFKSTYNELLTNYVGRPTPTTYAARLSELTGLHVAIKREDLCHTGAHKINNAIGQCLLAQRMGKKRIIAETGAGQHGVATATVCALFGLKCVIYMGAQDTVRQRLNVFRMKLLGAEVRPVSSGTQTLKDAMNEAMRDWVKNVRDTHYVIGSVAGPHPYPYMVREFQRIIGTEARRQHLEQFGDLPNWVFACVGGGSNAMGIFADFLDDPKVKLVGVEAAGKGLDTMEHAAPLTAGTPGVLHGSYSYIMQNDDGQILETHSISAGLDYPGVGPEHAFLKDENRVSYIAATDEEALEALQVVAHLEGLIIAFESAHAFVPVLNKKSRDDFGLNSGDSVLVNLSGRGDKDMETASRILDL